MRVMALMLREYCMFCRHEYVCVCACVCVCVRVSFGLLTPIYWVVGFSEPGLHAA